MTPYYGRRLQEGEEAEEHPSLNLLKIICTPDPNLVCLMVPTVIFLFNGQGLEGRET